MKIDSSYTISALTGKKGKDGEGQEVQLQYSANGISAWHDTYQKTDLYMRASTDGGKTWSQAMRITGEKGDKGETTNTIIFKANPSDVDNGEVYTCGFDSTGDEDENLAGFVLVNGVRFYAKGMTNTNCACYGYLVIPTSSTDKENPSVPVLAYDSCDGENSWYYLKNDEAENEERAVNITDIEKVNWIVLAKMYQFEVEGKCTVEPMTPCLLSSVNQEIDYHFGGLVSEVTQYTNASIVPYKVTQNGDVFSITAESAIYANRGAVVLNINEETPTEETAEMKIQFFNGTYWNEITSEDPRYPIAITIVAGYLPAIAGYYNSLKLAVPTVCGTYIQTLTSNKSFIDNLFANKISVGNAIQSSNYEKGVSGFSLTSNGKADLNELTIKNMRLTYDELENLVLGHSVFEKNEDGSANIGIGAYCLSESRTGVANTAIGYGCLRNISSGKSNVAIGTFALNKASEKEFLETQGIDYNGRNVAIGHNAMAMADAEGGAGGGDNTYNIAIGTETLMHNNGDYNIAIGDASLINNTEGYNNIGIGISALSNNEKGIDNIAIGNQALRSNSSGFFNIGIGWQALQENDDGTINLAIGNQALLQNKSGTLNLAIGNMALSSGGNNTQNTAIGHSALDTLINDDVNSKNNVALGFEAGHMLYTGSNNIFIGANTQPSKTNASNEINIGNRLFINQGGVYAGSDWTDKTLLATKDDIPSLSGYLKESAKNIGQSGYLKLTNGLIIQWGQLAKGSNLAKGTDYDFPVITMPTAFTNSYSLNLTIKVGGTTGTGGVELSYVTDSSAPLQKFKAHLYNRNGNTTIVTPVLNWFAIGK